MTSPGQTTKVAEGVTNVDSQQDALAYAIANFQGNVSAGKIWAYWGPRGYRELAAELTSLGWTNPRLDTIIT